MMTRFKYLVGGIVGILVLGLAVLGPSRFWNSARAMRERVNDNVESAKDDVQAAKEIQILLQDLDDKIDRSADELAVVQETEEASQKRVEELENEIARLRGNLTDAKQLLDQGKAEYEIHGCRYSRDEISADAMVRLDRCKQLEQELQWERETLAQLSAALGEGRQMLLEARSTRRQKSSELESLQAQLQNAHMLAQINELTSQFPVSAACTTELGEKLKAFRLRARQALRKSNQILGGHQESGVVNWEGPAGPTDASDAITEYLGDWGYQPGSEELATQPSNQIDEANGEFSKR